MIKKILTQAELETLATDLLSSNTHSLSFEWTDIEADYVAEVPEFKPVAVAEERPSKPLAYEVYKNEEVTVFTRYTKELKEVEDFTPVAFTVNQHTNRASYNHLNNVQPTQTPKAQPYHSTNTPTNSPNEWNGSYEPLLDNSCTAQKFQPCKVAVATFKQVEPSTKARSTTFGADEYPQLQWLAEQTAEQYKERQTSRTDKNTARATQRRHAKLQRLASKGKLPKHLEAELKSFTL